MGWPPTKRGWATAVTTGAFTLPTSVTTPAVVSRACLASAAIADTGTAMNVTSAPGSSPTASSTPSSRARSARDVSRSRPVTCQPRARSASPIEPPMSPVPTTTARRSVRPDAVEPGSVGAGSVGQVIAEASSALEVHVVQLVAGPFGGEVHHHPDAQRRAALDRQLARADQGHVAEADGPRRRGGEHRRDVLGGGEQDADDVVVTDVVGLEHARHQGLDALGDLIGSVLVDCGRAA